MVVREAYLTVKQMERIGIKIEKSVLDSDIDVQKQKARDASIQMQEIPYFPLYEKNDSDHPAAYYFTSQEVIIPAGLSELKQNIYEEWSRLDLEKESGSHKFTEKYPSASNQQIHHLYSYLLQFMKSDGTVTESALSFLSSVDYLLFREKSRWIKYTLSFQHPENFNGYSLPVWSYSFKNGKELLDGWVNLYQRYGLVPADGEILNWLYKLRDANTVMLTKEQYNKLKEYFRRADRIRLGNKYYGLSEKIFDNGQCWEVFEKAQPDINKIRCIFPDGEWLSAQAPWESESVKRAMTDGLIAIDFGTKSTVVVLNDQTKGNFHVLKPKRGYAGGNPLYPTILKFCSLEKFLETYEEEAGRPNTRWEDVSIDNSYSVSGKADSALGIFRSLKQWMLDPNSCGAVLRQAEAPDKPIILSAYGSKENSVDPVELYAYYLGLYANNNQDNNVFMRYRLSFSATCPEQIQYKMRESFERGIKKSLPASIVNSNEIKNFSVNCTCSEPAAYAVCALACMGVPSHFRKHFFYGIFDFGGGTCDFNYGVWGIEQDKSLHRDKYKIWMLGNGGDPFLGGENLLELLAVQVCMDEKEWFREQGYKISRPRCYEGGDEDFFSVSSEAANNLEFLVEQLRNPIWEKPDDNSEEFEIYISGLMQEGMDSGNDDSKESKKGDNGNKTSKMMKKFSKTSLLRLLVKRIYEGIAAFFDTFYRTLEEEGKKEVPQLCVFLAGSSCRSKLVRRTFEEYINQKVDNSRIKRVDLCDPIGAPEFEGHLPIDLWDEEQKERMRTRISRLGDLDGKTGVAYGLALYGKEVEIEDRCVKDRLLYYLGTKSFFDFDVLGGVRGERLVIGESVPFAVSKVCDLYYTDIIPKRGELRGVKTIVLNEQNMPMEENMTCFVRANSQTEISIFAVSGDNPRKNAPKKELIFDLQLGQFKNNKSEQKG